MTVQLTREILHEAVERFKHAELRHIDPVIYCKPSDSWRLHLYYQGRWQALREVITYRKHFTDTMILNALSCILRGP